MVVQSVTAAITLNVTTDDETKARIAVDDFRATLDAVWIVKRWTFQSMPVGGVFFAKVVVVAPVYELTSGALIVQQATAKGSRTAHIDAVRVHVQALKGEK